jgi:hypothetical protein
MGELVLATADLAPVDALSKIVPMLTGAATPVLMPIPSGAVKVLPRWAEEDGVVRWRVKYREQPAGENSAPTLYDDGLEWIELELRPFTRELPLTGLSSGVAHEFRVAIETKIGWSDWSDAISCVPPAPEVPGKPAAVFAIVQGPSTVIVRWTRPIDVAAATSCGLIQRYRLLVSWQTTELLELLEAGDQFQIQENEREIIINQDVDHCEVTDLLCLRDYRFQVAAENISGWGELSDPSPVVNMPRPVPPKLAAPTLRKATHHSALISWMADVPVDRFRFRHTASSDFEGKDIVETLDIPANLSQYTIRGLAPGTTYIFQVTSENKHGMGIWSESSLPLRTREGEKPSKIGGLTVPHIYKSFITLQWTPAAENGYPVTKHLLRLSFNVDMSNYTEIEPDVRQKDGFDQTDLVHLNKVKYYFQIASINSKGMSEFSDPVEVDMSRFLNTSAIAN